MAKRPDLKKIEARLTGGIPRTQSAGSDMRALLEYCRELEAENKRLQGIVTAAERMRANMDGHYVPAEDIWLFDGACEDSR